MHARLAMYKFKPGSSESVFQKAEAGLGPILRKLPGFVSYEVFRTGPDSGVSVSNWQTQAQAQDAVKAATEWVKANIAGEVASAETHVGEVVFSHRA
jgi:heme-degrading monooxygenase HmoA